MGTSDRNLVRSYSLSPCNPRPTTPFAIFLFAGLFGKVSFSFPKRSRLSYSTSLEKSSSTAPFCIIVCPLFVFVVGVEAKLAYG